MGPVDDGSLDPSLPLVGTALSRTPLAPFDGVLHRRSTELSRWGTDRGAEVHSLLSDAGELASVVLLSRPFLEVDMARREVHATWEHLLLTSRGLLLLPPRCALEVRLYRPLGWAPGPSVQACPSSESRSPLAELAALGAFEDPERALGR